MDAVARRIIEKHVGLEFLGITDTAEGRVYYWRASGGFEWTTFLPWSEYQDAVI